MRKKSVLLASVGLALLVGGASLLVAARAKARSAGLPQLHVSVQRQPSDIAKSISLAEAWDIILAYGRGWHDDAAVTRLYSSSVGVFEPEQAGRDGLRRTWQAELISSASPGRRLKVRVTDGVVVESSEQLAARPFRPITEKPKLDSPEAVERALDARPDLSPMKEKGKGFHFSLEAAEGGAIVIRVHGSFRGLPASVDVDATTSQVTSASRYTYAPIGGVLYSTDAGATWLASDLTERMVSSIAADPKREDLAYAAGPFEGRITVYQTIDDGKHWFSVGQLPEEAGSWPFDILVFRKTEFPILALGSSSGLWISRDGGETWLRNEGLPSGPAQRLAFVKGDSWARIFVSITAGENAGLYASTDLDRWEKAADGVYRLSHSYDMGAVLAIDERKPGHGLVFEYDTSYPVALPPRTLRAAGAFDGSAPFISEWSGGISVKVNKDGDWHGALDASLASLAVAPDFPSSEVAVAGGFRSGIYRSTDGGRTWKTVLADPSKLVPGSGEVYEVEFLSATHVIAINGGGFTWQSF